MRKSFIIAIALLLGACGQPQPDGYDIAREAYKMCLDNVSPAGDCAHYQKQYMLAATDRQVRQNDYAVAAQRQANQAAWARWYINSQRVTTCQRFGTGYTCQ